MPGTSASDAGAARLSAESDFIAALRGIATDPAARGLLDDAAVLPVAAGRLVLTHDMIVEGIHYLPDDPPEDVAWKLLAVNLSDLAAKGAQPLGCLLGYTLGRDDGWNARFVAGLGEALDRFAIPLLGGDSVGAPGPRVLGLTAIGAAGENVPDRRGAKPGDDLWVAGTVGDAGLGLALLRAGEAAPEALVAAYRRPVPLVAAGRALAAGVAAMADVSDGLLIDAARIAAASGLAVTVDLAAVPLSDAAKSFGTDRSARLKAATAGDDYALVFAAPVSRRAILATLLEPFGVSIARIGRFDAGSGLGLVDGADTVPLPGALGYEHGA